MECKREKFRDGIAQKYGIKRKTGENVSKIDDKSLQVSRKIIYKVEPMWSRLKRAGVEVYPWHQLAGQATTPVR